ncbi:hypothetical protein BJF79_15700 [Actinomadura sp. CNU-125]|nr:nickel insertion protein [Actinomadura sp. CNU-125]OLT21226.1 hypothetical protein BJF79_15700 [Actinomadura sp. CNU-125]
MALLAVLAREAPGLPPMRLEATGTGAGSRDTPARPNIVRVFLGEPEAAPEGGPEGEPRERPRETPGEVHREMSEEVPAKEPREMSGEGLGAAPGEVGGEGPEAEPGDGSGAVAVVLEANVDDLDPRVWPGVLASLLEAGASDAWLVPVLMKKGRPAHTLCVLGPPGRADVLRAAMFRLTSTLGVRERAVRKTMLRRGWARVDVLAARLPVKVGHRDGRVVQAVPEFEDAARLAAERGVPVRAVLDAAVAARTPTGSRTASPCRPAWTRTRPGDSVRCAICARGARRRSRCRC